MIDDIIKKLLAMPNITFTPATRAEFIERSNRIINNLGVPLTLKTFHDDLQREPKTKIYHELKSIEAYCSFWREMMIELDTFLAILHYTWRITHDKPMGGDNLLPILVQILPKDLPTLLRLQQSLELACDVDQSQYYLASINIAATFLIEQFDQEIDTNHTADNDVDAHEAAKIEKVVSKLRNRDFYAATYLQLKLKNLCISRMNDCYTQIYQELQLHDIHDYDFDFENISKQEKIQRANDKIMELFALKDQPPCTSYPELGKNVKKYISYHQYYLTLARERNDTSSNLNDLIYQFPCFEKELGDDLDEVKISLTSNMRAYLEIPEEKKSASMLNLFWPLPDESKIPFKRFMEFLTRKMQQLELVSDAKKETASSIPSAVNV